MAPGVGQEQQVIAMAQEEHVGLVEEEVEREADLEGMVGDVVRVKAVNRQMMVDAQHTLNHHDKTVNNAKGDSRKQESDSLTIEELDDASSDEDEDKGSKSISEKNNYLQPETVAAIRGEDPVTEEGGQFVSDGRHSLLNNASAGAPKVLMVAPTANGPTTLAGEEDEVQVGWSPEVLQAAPDNKMTSSPAEEEMSQSPPEMPNVRLSPPVAGSPSFSSPQRETFKGSRPSSSKLKSNRPGSSRGVDHLEAVATGPRSRPGSHTRVTVTRPGSATATHQDQLGHLDKVGQVSEALEPHVVVQQPAELVLVAEALRTPKAPVKLLQGGIPIKAKSRRKSLLDIALADLEKMEEKDENKIEADVTDNPAVTIVRADSICRSQTLPKRTRKVSEELKEWDVESATGEGPICISNIALVVYIFLGCVIGILTILNLLFGFHLILTFLLVLFVFILLILLTDNIGLDR